MDAEELSADDTEKDSLALPVNEELDHDSLMGRFRYYGFANACGDKMKVMIQCTACAQMGVRVNTDVSFDPYTDGREGQHWGSAGLYYDDNYRDLFMMEDEPALEWAYDMADYPRQGISWFDAKQNKFTLDKPNVVNDAA